MIAIPRTATFQYLLDLVGDGVFNGIDDVTSDVRANPGFTCRLGMDQARPLAQPMVGDGGFDLDNRYPGRKYSPEFAGSPVYQVDQTGHAAQVIAGFGVAIDYDDAGLDYDDPSVLYDGTVAFPLLTGFIDEPEQHPEIETQSVGIKLHSSLTLLQGAQSVSTALYSNIRTDQALGYLLDAIGWDPAKRAISVGDSVLSWWWLSGVSAFQAAVDIVNAEGVPARLWEDGSGVLHFENRNYRSTQARSTTSQATIYDQKTTTIDYDDTTIDYDDTTVDYDGGAIYRSGVFGYAPATREIVNDASIALNIRAVQPLTAVWNNGSLLVLSAGQTATIFVKSQGDPWTGVVVPTVTTDYVVTAGSLSAVTATVLSAVTVKLTFTAGGSGATVAGPGSATTGPQLRVQPVTVVSTQTIVPSIDTSASKLQHGTRPPNSDWKVLPELSPASAQAVADALVNYAKTARPVVTFELINRDSDHLWLQLTLAPSTRVTIVDTQVGVANDVWIEQAAHAVRSLGLDHRTTFIGARTNDDLSPGLWDAGVWDTALWGR